MAWFAVPDWLLQPEVLGLLVFVAAFAETWPALGLVVPGQSTIVLAAFVAAREDVAMVPLLACTAAGAVTGDVLGYALGRRWGIGLLGRLPRRLRPTPNRIAWLTHLFHEHGLKTILLARFQPLTRCFAPMLAGAARMGVPRFMAASVVGASVAATLLVLGGYLSGLGFDKIGKAFGTGLAILGAVLLGVLLLWVLALRRRALERRALVPIVRAASFPADGAAVRRLLSGYFHEFAEALGRQDFKGELADVARYEGGMWLAEAKGAAIGCVALRDMGQGDMELKRMAVLPDWRGCGVGSLLLGAALQEARSRGAKRVLLDTTAEMVAARRLYARFGFREVGAFWKTPLPDPVFMCLDLEGTGEPPL